MSQPEPPASCASCGFRHFRPAWITATERRWVCEKCGECGPVIPPTTLQELETEAKKLPPVVWPPEEELSPSEKRARLDRQLARGDERILAELGRPATPDMLPEDMATEAFKPLWPVPKLQAVYFDEVRHPRHDKR